MIFAVNEINRNTELLNSVKLGYKIYNDCGTMDILRAALSLVSGQKRKLIEKNCTWSETVLAILGHSGSRPTIPIAQTVGRFQVPVVSERKYNLIHAFAYVSVRTVHIYAVLLNVK